MLSSLVEYLTHILMGDSDWVGDLRESDNADHKIKKGRRPRTGWLYSGYFPQHNLKFIHGRWSYTYMI